MQAWQQVARSTSARDYIKDIALKQAEVLTEQNTVHVSFSCSKLLPKDVLNDMRSALQRAFEPALLDVDYCFEVDIASCFDQVLPYIRDFVLKCCPCARPFAAHIKYRLEGGALRAMLPGEIPLALWNRADCTARLQDRLRSSFGFQGRVLTELGEAVKIQPRQESDGQLPPQRLEKRPPAPAQQPSDAPQRRAGKRDDTQKFNMLYGKQLFRKPTPLAQLEDGQESVCVQGIITKVDSRELRNGTKTIVLFTLTDYEDSIGCKLMLENRYVADVLAGLKKGGCVRAYGDIYSDKYTNFEIALRARAVALLPPPPQRMDEAEEKRVELHLHTHMSAMDGLLSAKDAVATAARWGHKALAVTDHGVVQAFPEFYSAAKKAGIKAIFGTEGYLIDDSEPIGMDGSFVVFDVETTGLDEKFAHIIELGAVKVQGGKITDEFHTMIKPPLAIPASITELTGIDDAMVEGSPDIGSVLRDFAVFAQGCTLVAHNARFDTKFICHHGLQYDIEFDQPYVDTLMLSRYLLRDELENHKLGTIGEHFAIDFHAHRALDDARATAEIFVRFCDMIRAMGGKLLPAVYPRHRAKTGKAKKRANHIILLVKDQEGLTNLYKLISYSHLDYFGNGRPCMPRSMLLMFSGGLIRGSACEAGELMRAVVAGEPDETLIKIADFYDFLEIQPIGNNAFMVRNGQAGDDEALRDYNRKVVELAERLNKPCAATGDVHFLEPRDEVYRRVIMAFKGFSDADEQAPLYFKTTEDMLREFSYLGAEKAREVVIETPNAIAEMCQMLKPFPFETCAPIIDGAEDELVTSCHEKARAIYGDPLPPEVDQRLERELGSITKYGYSVLYIIARKLVLKSNSDGYLVGSRGSVGSSLAAFMSGITEVNALPPHYICPNCKHSDFEVDLSKYQCGCDMPDKDCPACGHKYNKDGFNIPFETFLGFEGDKVPDIDLNFSGENQSSAHRFTEELFGKGHVFRAGTISGVQEKTAFGYVKRYAEERNRPMRTCEIERIAQGCCDVKRTTGQHPGGVVVVPKNRSVYEFTPLNHPADDRNSPITTHFDFASMHDTLVKLDILGHDDPTVIRMLQDLTGIDPKSIPLDDEATMSIFSSTDAIGVAPGLLESQVATYGIPEFGTSFVRQMLVDTKPTTFEELVRISGLSHGTDVWLGNAQELINSGTATLSEAICTRDDIMNFLILCGVEKKMAFTIMEYVRKGKAAKEGMKPEMEEAMRANNVPEWYIDSCKKIKYMFPRAHAAAYVMMAFRIAYCKVHYPEAFYAAYFTVRADEFDITLARGGADTVKKRLAELRASNLTDKEARQITILEVVMEMNLRNIELENIDLMRSHATKFIIDGGHRLLPPINAIGGLGDRAAESIFEARSGGEFISCEDIINRAKVNKGVIETLKAAGVIDGLPDTNQLTLF